MALLDVKNVSFTFANQVKALKDVSFQIEEGEFVLLTGSTGSGKTTLLRLIKQELAPYGKMTGTITYQNRDLLSLSPRERASEIGYVFQNAESQIVSDFVYQELAFGLENLGYSSDVIRLRVGEMASFFGINSWFRHRTAELSGGQKQMLNLASIMVMEPKILLLDEPTSQLDPIATTDFLQTLKRLNSELGLTIIIVEHHLEEVWTLVDRVLVLDQGELVADNPPRIISKQTTIPGLAFPSPVKIYREFSFTDECPQTINEAKKWLSHHFHNHVKKMTLNENCEEKPALVNLENIWFRYEKKANDILRNLHLDVRKGEILTIVGGNGSGKSTLLKILAGLIKPYLGKVRFLGKTPPSISFLPQNPQILFVADTVMAELKDMEPYLALSKADFSLRLQQNIALFSLQNILDQHPYDLCGGEQQKLAITKILLKNPDLLLLDEPSKSLDASFKKNLMNILNDLHQSGKTIVIVSHDIEFAARVSHRNAMLFDGTIVADGHPHSFFSGNTFYTTNANRLSRHMYESLITEEEVIMMAQLNGAK
ncbi:MAG TPA: ATP-binding cassette domain-containing protein [Bacilli bacterium]|nr:ATP-binding cassette domain-containing protein [Bacilli bacterium]